MQNAGQFGPGAAASAHPPSQFVPSEPSPNGGSTTSSLRQFRKKDVDKNQVEPQQQQQQQQPLKQMSESHVARIAPHNHYPPVSSDVYRYSAHQFSGYGPQMKYSDLAEASQPNPISTSVIQKSKPKDYMEMCNVQQQQHLNNHPQYFPENGHYMPNKDSVQGYPTGFKPESHFFPKDQHQYQSSLPPHHPAASKFNAMMAQNMRKYNPGPTDNPFLNKLSKLHPSMARSIISDHHLQDSQPAYVSMDQRGIYAQQNHRYYSGSIHHQSNLYSPNSNYSPTGPTHTYPNYPPSSSCSYSRTPQMGTMGPRYPHMERSLSPSRRGYPEGMHVTHMNYHTVHQKMPMGPNYPPHQYRGPEYSQHYQHRRMPQDCFPPQACRPTSYMQGHHQISGQDMQELAESTVSPSDSLKKFIENWADEEPSGDINSMEGNVNLRDKLRDDAPVGTVFMINATDVQDIENNGIPIVTSDNGGFQLTSENYQYLLKNGMVDNTGIVRIIEANKEISIDASGNQERVVNLQIMEAPKSDCMMVSKHLRTPGDATPNANTALPKQEEDNRRVVIHQNTILNPPKHQADQQSVVHNLSSITTKELVDKNCSPINLDHLEHNNLGFSEPEPPEETEQETAKPDENPNLINAPPSVGLSLSEDLSSENFDDKSPGSKSMPIIDFFGEAAAAAAAAVNDDDNNSCEEDQSADEAADKLMEDDEHEEEEEEEQREVDAAECDGKSANNTSVVTSPPPLQGVIVNLGIGKSGASADSNNVNTELIEEESPDDASQRRRKRIFSVDDIIYNIGNNKSSSKECDISPSDVETAAVIKFVESEVEFSSFEQIDSFGTFTKSDTEEQPAANVPLEETATETSNTHNRFQNAFRVEGNSVVLQMAGELMEIHVNVVNGKKIINVTALSDATAVVDYNDNYQFSSANVPVDVSDPKSSSTITSRIEEEKSNEDVQEGGENEGKISEEDIFCENNEYDKKDASEDPSCTQLAEIEELKDGDPINDTEMNVFKEEICKPMNEVLESPSIAVESPLATEEGCKNELTDDLSSGNNNGSVETSVCLMEALQDVIPEIIPNNDLEDNDGSSVPDRDCASDKEQQDTVITENMTENLPSDDCELETRSCAAEEEEAALAEDATDENVCVNVETVEAIITEETCADDCPEIETKELLSEEINDSNAVEEEYCETEEIVVVNASDHVEIAVIDQAVEEDAEEVEADGVSTLAENEPKEIHLNVKVDEIDVDSIMDINDLGDGEDNNLQELIIEPKEEIEACSITNATLVLDISQAEIEETTEESKEIFEQFISAESEEEIFIPSESQITFESDAFIDDEPEPLDFSLEDDVFIADPPAQEVVVSDPLEGIGVAVDSPGGIPLEGIGVSVDSPEIPLEPVVVTTTEEIIVEEQLEDNKQAEPEALLELKPQVVVVVVKPEPEVQILSPTSTNIEEPPISVSKNNVYLDMRPKYHSTSSECVTPTITTKAAKKLYESDLRVQHDIVSSSKKEELPSTKQTMMAKSKKRSKRLNEKVQVKSEQKEMLRILAEKRKRREELRVLRQTTQEADAKRVDRVDQDEEYVDFKELLRARKLKKLKKLQESNGASKVKESGDHLLKPKITSKLAKSHVERDTIVKKLNGNDEKPTFINIKKDKKHHTDIIAKTSSVAVIFKPASDSDVLTPSTNHHARKLLRKTVSFSDEFLSSTSNNVSEAAQTDPPKPVGLHPKDPRRRSKVFAGHIMVPSVSELIEENGGAGNKRKISLADYVSRKRKATPCMMDSCGKSNNYCADDLNYSELLLSTNNVTKTANNKTLSDVKTSFVVNSSDWEDSNSPAPVPESRRITEECLIIQDFSGLIKNNNISSKKPVIDVNELTPALAENPHDRKLQEYKDKVDSQLSSLNIQIPASKLNKPHVPSKLHLGPYGSPESSTLVARFLNNEKLSQSDMEKIKKIISYKRSMQKNGRSPSKSPASASASAESVFGLGKSPATSPDLTAYETRSTNSSGSSNTNSNNNNNSRLETDPKEVRLHLKKVNAKRKLMMMMMTDDEEEEEEEGEDGDSVIANQISENDNNSNKKTVGGYSVFNRLGEDGLPKIIFKRNKRSSLFKEPVVELVKLNLDELEKVKEKYNVTVRHMMM